MVKNTFFVDLETASTKTKYHGSHPQSMATTSQPGIGSHVQWSVSIELV